MWLSKSFCVVVTLIVAASATAQPPEKWLITPAEKLESDRIEHARGGTKSIDIAPPTASDPAIELIAPKPGEPLVSPVDIEFRFTTAKPAYIDPASVRVLYGFANVDITSRLREWGALINQDGLSLSKAPLQPGSYRFDIEVQNSLGKKTRRTVRATIK